MCTNIDSSLDHSTKLPRIIWILWFQGEEHAPETVKKCILSWKLRNSGWDVRVLDSDNIESYLAPHEIIKSETYANISKPALSDIIRINLLSQYGGVWVDATCFCCQPLDNWIHEYTKSSFFAFLGHRADTIVSSWFLASQKNCYLTETLCAHVNQYWNDNPTTKPMPRGHRILKLILNKNHNRTRYWFSRPLLKWLKIKPYFWFHYIFTQLLNADQKFNDIWERTPKLDADTPHKLQSYGLLKPPDDEIKKQIDSKIDKVYKLNWKIHKQDSHYETNNLPEESTIAYLLNSIQHSR